MAEGELDIIPLVCFPLSFLFQKKDHSQELPRPSFSLHASPPLADPAMPVSSGRWDPDTHPDRLSLPPPPLPSFPVEQSLCPSSPVLFSSGHLGTHPTVLMSGTLIASAWSLAHHTECGFCKPACLWPEFHSYPPDKDHGFLPKSTGVQRPPGWGSRPPCLKPHCLPTVF